VRTRGFFEVEREDWDVMPRSSLLVLFTRVRGRGILRSSRSPVMQQVGNRDDNPLCHRTRGMQLVTRLYRLAGSRTQKGLEC